MSDPILIGPKLSLDAKFDSTNNCTRINVTFLLESGQLTTADWFGLFDAADKNNKKVLQERNVLLTVLRRFVALFFNHKQINL